MKTFLLIMIFFSQLSFGVDIHQVKIDALLDGLHKDAHEGNFQAYFARYTEDAVFLGTDKTERWTIEEFKAYAKEWKIVHYALTMLVPNSIASEIGAQTKKADNL